MKKMILTLMSIGFLYTTNAQNKPEHGRWSMGIGIGMGNHVHERPNKPMSSNHISFYTTHFFLSAEKHHSSYFSSNIEYGLATRPGHVFNSNSLSYIPSLNIRTRGRLVFSLGLRAGAGFNNYHFGEEGNIILNQVYRIRILLGNTKTFRRDYKGEINLIFEPFYFWQTRAEFWGANRQIRLQYVFPLSK